MSLYLASIALVDTMFLVLCMYILYNKEALANHIHAQRVLDIVREVDIHVTCTYILVNPLSVRQD